jgi:membrane-bound lytic murein transglycosylase F
MMRHGGNAVPHRLTPWAAACSLVLTLTGCSLFDDNKLAAVRSAGELVVATRPGLATYYPTPEGFGGFEYDLAKAFADSLGVRLKVVVADRVEQIFTQLVKGDIDFAAAGLTVTEARRRWVRFTPPYRETQQQVVYRLGTKRPADAAALVGHQIEVPAGTSHAEQLNALKQDHPGLLWTEVPDKTSDDLLEMVWEGLLDITLADDHVVMINRQYFPELQVAFDLGERQPIAWAFPLAEDDTLFRAAARFLDNYRVSGQLASLVDRYYGPASRSNFINLTVYRLRIQNRLPLYQRLFQRVAQEFDIDWRLLAAIGYQESYWDPAAVSPTGVRGLMMLTEETAEQIGVADRLDAEQSVRGGARYFRQMLDRLTPGVTGPDRLWMALAAYNVGFYHLEDARALTRQQGGDPNTWRDVKERLPLLASIKWARQTKFGLARGHEAVMFVNRVRTYYDVLARLDEEERARDRSAVLDLRVPAI